MEKTKICAAAVAAADEAECGMVWLEEDVHILHRCSLKFTHHGKCCCPCGSVHNRVSVLPLEARQFPKKHR